MKFIVCIDAENYSQVMQAAQQLKFEHEFPIEYISADSPLAKMAFKDAEPFFTGK
jgi:hypothetical protein